jgi:hypothetical protein
MCVSCVLFIWERGGGGGVAAGVQELMHKAIEDEHNRCTTAQSNELMDEGLETRWRRRKMDGKMDARWTQDGRRAGRKQDWRAGYRSAMPTRWVH